MAEKQIRLKPGRDKSVKQKHPWIFSGAVANVQGDPAPGETVVVRNAGGEFLGRAAFSPESQIRARMWTWDPDEPVDESFFRRKIQSAVNLRQFWIPPDKSNAARLVYAESDGLPGFIVDRYQGWMVVQVLTAGAEYWLETLVSTLVEVTGITNVYERSDVDVRRLEGLEPRTGLLRGIEPQGPVEITENGFRFMIDFRAGQKTGFYLDQRTNREQVGKLCAGRDVLNCFSYTGGFTIYALAGGARNVLSVDTSTEALAQAAQHVHINRLPEDRSEWLEGDVFQVLRKFRDQGASFDLIVLDPPKFAQTAAQAQRAARGYKDINLLAFKLLRPGGILASFSCSGGISADLFQKIVAGSALDAGVEAKILRTLTQDVDHPVALNFPESAYLKGLICEI